ncbi:flavin reductase [Aliishimia ponticola]|uniref:Flavin reductase n=1 Tax=Aliishimia ponticola TaxID=2499833 RepID=A0A4S4NI79_9RHOB|nr:flavin reductase family protein [Aliishimia ponticola]THH38585.1 flavin reductase [Aliishimia ponticola]
MIFEPDGSNTRDLRDCFARFTTGVTIVTCPSEHGPVGMTANSFSSISLDPPLVLWAASRKSRRFAAFDAAPKFAIHVLSAAQKDLCDLFAKDGFALRDIAHDTNAAGVPLLADCLACFECTRTDIHPAGDHALILGKVTRARWQKGDALAFFASEFTTVAQP